MERYRIYVDTSVIGGCLDEEFAEPSLRLIDEARRGRRILLLSDVVLKELEGAPLPVRAILRGLPRDATEMVPFTAEVTDLRDAYLAARIVGPASSDDAAHVAAATIARADAIVSWNFRHIVHLQKIKAYNAVNLQRGHGILTIVTPLEAVSHEQTAEEEDL